MTEQRKLAAVMFTDIVGYTALMFKDEQNALTLLRKNRKLQQALVKKHNGEFIKEMGDGTLLCFQSALDAVRCAMAIQQSVKDDPDLNLRIGIHLGDIVFKDGDVFGDGVNVASRIEKLAEGGGICISEQIYSLTRNQPDVKITFLDEKKLKNVDYPVKIYQVADKTLMIGTKLYEKRNTTISTHTPRRKKLLIISATSLCTLMLVVAAIIFIRGDDTIDSLAILPFTYPADQSEIQYLSESIPDRILYKLQKLPNLKRVIPFTSVLSYYREGLHDARVVGKKFGVNAVGIGRISKIGENLEVNIEIIDVKNNNLILKEPYTVELSQIVNMPIIIAQDIFDKLGHELAGDEQTHLLKRESENHEAYQNYMMGRFFWNKRTPAGIQSAIEYFNRAITRDSSFALAYAGLADAYLVLPQYSAILLKDVWGNAKKAAERAMALAPHSSEASDIHANLLSNERKWEEARTEIQKAIALDSNNSDAHFSYGMLMIILGDFEGGVSELKTALHWDPLSMVTNRNLGQAYTFQHQYEKAIEQFEKTLAIDPDEAITYMLLGGVYFLTKDTEKSVFNLNQFYKLIHLSNAEAIVKKSFPDENFKWSYFPRYLLEIQSEVQRTNHPLLSRPLYQSMIYALLGDEDNLFHMLNKAVDLDDYQLYIYLQHPILDPFRSDLRFRDVLKRTNLDRYYE